MILNIPPYLSILQFVTKILFPLPQIVFTRYIDLLLAPLLISAPAAAALKLRLPVLPLCLTKTVLAVCQH